MKLIDGNTASFLMKLSALIGLEDSFTPLFSSIFYTLQDLVGCIYTKPCLVSQLKQLAERQHGWQIA